MHVAMLAKDNHLRIIICSSWCVFVDDNIVVTEQQKTKSKKIKVPKYFKMESEILKHYFKYGLFFFILITQIRFLLPWLLTYSPRVNIFR